MVVSTNAVNFLERLVSEMTCCVSSGTLNHTHSFTHLSYLCLYLVLIIVFYIVQSSQLAARVIINYLLTYLLSNWHRAEPQSARMSEIKNCRLGLYDKL